MKITQVFFFLVFSCSIALYSAVPDSIMLNSASLLHTFEDARSIGISGRNMIYVADASAQEIYCLDSTGKVISTAGSFGSGKESFNSPEGVAVTPFSVFVCDRNNRRIKELTYSLQTRALLNTSVVSSSFYPEIICSDNSGALYLFNNEQLSIVKFTPGSEIPTVLFRQRPELKKLLSMAVVNQELFCLSGGKIFVFDLFGNSLETIRTIPEGGLSLFTNGTMLGIVYSDKIITLNYQTGEYSSFLLPSKIEDEIKDCAAMGSDFYLLTPAALYRYSR